MIDKKVDFAKKLGVAFTTYNGWETEKSYPKLEEAFIIAKKLNKEISEIWYLEQSRYYIFCGSITK